MRKSNCAFSLTELMVVLGVMAVLGGVLFPSLMFWQKGRELRDAAESLQAAVDSARTRAIAQGNVYGVMLKTDTSGVDRFQQVSLFELDEASDNMVGTDHRLPASVRFQLPLPGSGVSATTHDTSLISASDGLVAFRPSGEMEPRYLADTATDPAITLAGPGGKTRTLTIQRVTGKVTTS